MQLRDAPLQPLPPTGCPDHLVAIVAGSVVATFAVETRGTVFYDHM